MPDISNNVSGIKNSQPSVENLTLQQILDPQKITTPKKINEDPAREIHKLCGGLGWSVYTSV